jgi:hypothetical protein
MKLLLINTIEEYQNDVFNILKKAEISVFSVTPIKGYKNEGNHYSSDAWFGNQKINFESLIIYSFTNEHLAKSIIDLLNEYNKSHKEFPVRGYILPVEASTN